MVHTETSAQTLTSQAAHKTLELSMTIRLLTASLPLFLILDL